VPEIASLDAQWADGLFVRLASESKPRVTFVREPIFGVVFTLLAVGSYGTLMACVLSFSFSLPSWITRRRRLLIPTSVVGLVICILAWHNVPHIAPGPTMGAFAEDGGVEVVSHQQVGIFDVRVIRGDSSDAVIRWLQDNEFLFDTIDTNAFNAYVRDGWCFVVAMVSNDAQSSDVTSGGMIAPLILRFRHAAPVYPLALTGAAGHKTHVLLYLAADHKMTCGERLPLRYAAAVAPDDTNGVPHPSFLQNLIRAEPRGFITEGDLATLFFCRFQGTLTPSQMREDLSFTIAPDDQVYREHRVTW
jgi:hypothetical protein